MAAQFIVPFEETKIMREVFLEQVGRDWQPFSSAWREMLMHAETPCHKVESVGWMGEHPADGARSFTLWSEEAQKWRDRGWVVKEVYA